MRAHMAAAHKLLSDAIVSAIKKTPSQSQRATKVKEVGQEILLKIGHGEREPHADTGAATHAFN